MSSVYSRLHGAPADTWLNYPRTRSWNEYSCWVRAKEGLAPALIIPQPVSPLSFPESERSRFGTVRRPRVRERRSGLAQLLDLLARELVEPTTPRLRKAFEDALPRVLPVRYARLSVGQAVATGPSPMVRERGVIEVPVSSGMAVLEVAKAEATPFDDWEWQLVGAVAQLAALVLEIDRLQAGRASTAPRPTTCGLVGSSAIMRTLRERIQRAARRDVPVLVEGESGVGKELVARQIHELSPRARAPFVAVNCAALVESLLEAELFGIEDRTATGVRGRRGKFELADGGTLFLDEVGDLSPTAQAKLLRVLQEHSLERVGGSTAQRIDVRVVAATNRTLRALVDQGRFRLDLFYRLNCVEIHVPPLRERREDLPELTEFFLRRLPDAQGVRVTPEARTALASYDWPGNVRELERVLQRAVTLADDHTIGVADLPDPVVARHRDVLWPSLEQQHSIRLWRSRYARLMLHRCNDNRRETCRILGITYHTLKTYLREGQALDASFGDAAIARAGQPVRERPAPGAGASERRRAPPARAAPAASVIADDSNSNSES